MNYLTTFRLRRLKHRILVRLKMAYLTIKSYVLIIQWRFRKALTCWTVGRKREWMNRAIPQKASERFRVDRFGSVRLVAIFGHESEAREVLWVGLCFERGSYSRRIGSDDTGLFLLVNVLLSTYNSYYEYHRSTGFSWRLKKLVIKFDR